MKKFTKEMVNNYADNLLIGLTPKENKLVLDEFEVIDKNCDIVNSIPNIGEVEPMTQCLDNFESTFREDTPEKSDSIEDLLANCEDVKNREIELPRVVK